MLYPQYPTVAIPVCWFSTLASRHWDANTPQGAVRGMQIHPNPEQYDLRQDESARGF